MKRGVMDEGKPEDGAVGHVIFRNSPDRQARIDALISATAATSMDACSAEGVGADMQELVELGAIHAPLADDGPYWQLSESPEIKALRENAERDLRSDWPFALMLGDELYAVGCLSGDAIRSAWDRWKSGAFANKSLFEQ